MALAVGYTLCITNTGCPGKLADKSVRAYYSLHELHNPLKWLRQDTKFSNLSWLHSNFTKKINYNFKCYRASRDCCCNCNSSKSRTMLCQTGPSVRQSFPLQSEPAIHRRSRDMKKLPDRWSQWEHRIKCTNCTLLHFSPVRYNHPSEREKLVT